MKVLSIVVPVYNEQETVMDVYATIKRLFDEKLPGYGMELLFIDNASTDNTKPLLEALCSRDERVKAIFNNSNVGFHRSSFYGITQSTGDAAVLLYADLQEPPEVIPQFVAEWEKGAKVVVGVKNRSTESKLMYWVRQRYYNLLTRISDNHHIAQYNGFGLYDKSFVEILRKLKDPLPYFRGIVSELGPRSVEVCYTQQKRKKGKSHYNFLRMWDFAMLGITSSSKAIMRLSTFAGIIIGCVSLIVALVTLIQKLCNWDSFPLGTAALVVGMFFLGAVELFFIGFLGEYILNINTRVMQHPLVTEEKRINLPPLEGDNNAKEP